MFRAHALFLTALAALPNAAIAQHGGDIILAVADGRIVTGELHAGELEPAQVFASEFGELISNWTDEPGFDSEAGVFTHGLRIGFDITAAVRSWDGESFIAIPPEQIRISAGAEQIETPASDVLVPGLLIGAAGATGKFHHHVGFELLHPAAPGIYLLELELWAEGGEPARSEPLWIVFNQMRPEPEHLAAVEWAQRVLAGGCRADLDGDGQLTFFDFLTFQTLFSTGDPAADFDADGDLTFFDFLAFQQEFAAGCD